MNLTGEEEAIGQGPSSEREAIRYLERLGYANAAQAGTYYYKTARAGLATWSGLEDYARQTLTKGKPMDIEITGHSVAEWRIVINVPVDEWPRTITDAAEAAARRLRPGEKLLDLSWTAPDGTVGGRRW